MTLTVLSVAYPLAAVGPDAVGGAEQILSRLDVALTRAGHRSIVVACEGSVTAGTLVATPAVRGALDPPSHRLSHVRHRRAIEAALARWPVDIVHMHGIDFQRYLPPPGPPVLVTLHLPPSWYPPEVFRLDRPRTHLHPVSEPQRRACPPDALLLPVIGNGVPLPPTSPHARRRFALALGRICPEKNLHVALDAGRLADCPVLLAGEVFGYPEHERYFHEQIVPRLDRHRRYLGPVGSARKHRLLAAARCLLQPSLAPETSSLVAMEALARGTPVVAFPSGALPEIVEPGRTGLLVHDARQMAEAIHAVGSIDADVCREAARRRFSLPRMIARYFAVYEQLAAGGG